MGLKDLVKRGGKWHPPRLILYGEAKVGKTSTLAQAPNPLFIGTDDGRRRLEVDGLDIPPDWETFVSQLETISEEAPLLGYKSVVTDTLNGVVDLCARYICRENFGGKWSDQRTGFMAWGGSGGWGAVSEEVRRVLPLYDALIDSGVWVLMVAHSTAARVRNPLEGDYDRYQPAVDRRVWARFREWADVILRVDFRKALIEEGGRKRAVSDSTRILRASPTVAEDVGTRVGYDLPAELPFSWDSIESNLGRADEILEGIRAGWSSLSKDQQQQAEAFLGTSLEELEEAPAHKARTLLNRMRLTEEVANE